MNNLTEQKQGSSIIDVGTVNNDSAMTQMWGLNSTNIQEINKSAMIRSSKHGMFASVPIVCKGVDCAYKDACTVDPLNRTAGQRCPMEIGSVIARFNYWCNHFELDISGEMIKDEEATDASLIRDLVNFEIQMMRCENKIAISGDFMGLTLADIDKKCKPYYESIVAPESEYLLTLQDKKIKILNQLNATRKDKASDKSRISSPTESAIRIFQEVQEAIKKQSIIDIDSINFDEDFDDASANDYTLNEIIESSVEPEEE